MKRLPWRTSVRDEVDGELAFHLEMIIRELMEAGMTEHDARAEARQRLGDTRSVTEECRRYAAERDARARRTQYRDELRQDLSFAWRQLARAPGFSIVAVATLALGIGATAAVFSAVDAVVLRPLPFPHSERVVAISPNVRGTGANPPLVPEFLALQASGVFESVGAVVPGIGLSTKLFDTPEMLAGARVSSSYFAVFGMPPELGHAFTAADDVPGAPLVALISHRVWVQRFNRDRGVIGRIIQVDGSPRAIVGVMAPNFDARGSADILLPLVLPAASATNYSQRFLTVFARLKPGQTLAQAEAGATTVDRRVFEQMPGRIAPLSSFTVQIIPVRDQLIAGSARLLYLLLGAVGFVMLISCTNVANLLLARATSRSRELAVRAALGAGRARLVRQLLTESLLLGAAGVAGGLVVGFAVLRVFLHNAPRAIPRLEQATIDGRVLAFTLGVGLTSCVVFGLLPALRGAGPRIFAGLRDGGRFGAGLARDRLRGALVSVEVALAISLLIASGLLLHSAWIVQHVDPGFETRGVLTARIALPAARYAEAGDITRTFDRIRDDAARIPGVRSAALSVIPPLSGLVMSSSVAVGTTAPTKDSPQANARIVSPGYFGAMGMTLRAGRDFARTDDAGAPRVVAINETLAKLLWPALSPAQVVGKRVNALSPDTTLNVMSIVAVAADVRDEQVTVPAKPAFFVPVDQMPPVLWPLLQRSAAVVLKSAAPDADANALVRPLQRVIAEVDPSLPVADPHTLVRALEVSRETAHATTLLLSALGGIALLLAMVGIYGVVAYFVGQRTQEIGLRMALGATHARIWQFVARRGLTPVGVGLVIGAALSMVTGRALGTLLYGVRGWDPVTFIGVTLLLAFVALMATFVPARRAMRIAPSNALNQP